VRRSRRAAWPLSANDGSSTALSPIVWQEAGNWLFTFTRLPPNQWRSVRTTDAIERLHEEFRRRGDAALWASPCNFPRGIDGLLRVPSLMKLWRTDMDHIDKRALSVAEAAKAAGVGRTTFFEEIRRGRITARKVGRRTIITIDALEAWLDSLPKRTPVGNGD
jgi:excisionase family DNA binding protein